MQGSQVRETDPTARTRVHMPQPNKKGTYFKNKQKSQIWKEKAKYLNRCASQKI